MAGKRRDNPSPGPSTRRKTLSDDPMVVDVEPMTVDSSMTASTVPDVILEALADHLKFASLSWSDDDGSDHAFTSDDILPTIYSLVYSSLQKCPNPYMNVVDIAQFKENARMQSASGFFDLLRKALQGDDLSLWVPVVAHDVFHKVVPRLPHKSDEEVSYTQESQAEALLRSWETPFIETGTLTALKLHVTDVVSNDLSYAPYCSIVQSSGMGKSRLVDEFSKTNFLIPINLRMENDGFPPPDRAIRDVLTKVYKSGTDGSHIRTLMRHFLFELFEKTCSVIVNDLKDVTTRSQCITKFREFMTIGLQAAGVGEKRENFYHEVTGAVETRMKKQSETSSQQVKGALQKLMLHINPLTTHTANFPCVFIAFDEAHPLADLGSTERRTFFTELRSVLRDVQSNSFFCFFLSTTNKISGFSMPRDIAGSARMERDYIPSIPFSDLGFDHLMHNRKIFTRFKSLEDVTSTECVVYMGRPLWGSRYTESDISGQRGILWFARMKLLGSEEYYRNLSFTADQHCAVLSQRLALEIDTSAYVTSGSTRDYHMSDKAQLQISNHMRVCISIPEDHTSVQCIAASEPILSEAASSIMRNYPHFQLPDALLNVLDSYAINRGERGELLVSAFIMWARDLYVKKIENQLFPYNFNSTQLCPIFSVLDLLSNLFSSKHFPTISDSLPSLCRQDHRHSSMKFSDVFKNTKMHFNHMIQPLGVKTISRFYLLKIMARGAAALGANCQAGYDMVYPFLYGSSELDVNNVGFMIGQVKNHATHKYPSAKLFRKMDPFTCSLLKEVDMENFTVPIVRIVFALGGDKPKLTQMRYKSPWLGAATLDAAGNPKFTSYDFWCSGIGPGLLQPVDECNENDQMKWKKLLAKTEKLDGVFSESKIPSVRRSQYPGGGDDNGHYNAWIETDNDNDNDEEEEDEGEQ